MILHSELKRQRKIVKNLKKKSLWSKTLEEVIFQPYLLSYFIVCTITLCRLVYIVSMMG
jgi:hypothetical protein